jgi:hypothetical protein
MNRFAEILLDSQSVAISRTITADPIRDPFMSLILYFGSIENNTPPPPFEGMGVS